MERTENDYHLTRPLYRFKDYQNINPEVNGVDNSCININLFMCNIYSWSKVEKVVGVLFTSYHQLVKTMGDLIILL